MESKMTEEVQDNACVVCFKGVEIYSIGQCDHPVCYECSTRMRVLCRQNECPICRQDMPKVIFTKHIRPYNSIKNVDGPIDKKYKVVFESDEEKKAYDKILAHECPKCSKVFVSFSYLKDHVRRAHQLNYCDLCVENLRIYSRERRCYNRAELNRHRKDGDPDDRSHRGHPLCEFCDTRYMDNDELYRHLRRDHLYCHFCDADGLHQYYSSYDFLRDHFRSEHYLCEDGECINEKFTAVFRTEIDLKAHRTTVHGRGLGKAGLKQARTLELEFTLAPRPRPVHNRARHREEDPIEVAGASGVYESVNDEGNKRNGQGGACGVPSREPVNAPELRREEDFPALGSEQSAASVSLRLTSSKQPVTFHTSIQVNHPRFTTKVTSQNNYNHHFPALDSASGSNVAVTSVSWSASSGGSRKQGPAYKPTFVGQNLPPAPEDFPSLASPSSSSSVSQVSKTSTGVGTQSEPPSKPKPKEDTAKLSVPPKTKKKKSKSAKAPTETNPSTTNSTNSNGESKSKKNKKEQKPAQKQETQKINNNNDVENIDLNDNVENIIKAMSIMTEKQRNSHLKELQTRRDDFPSLGAPPGFSGAAPAPCIPEEAPRWEVKKPSKPPPGLAKPPPGLPPPPPPGFSVLNGGFPPLIGGPDGEDLSLLTDYITPNNFTKRNTSLVKLINSSLVGETIDEFKSISGAYRNGSLHAGEYYAHCREMLGEANFKELFPELLALLPDVKKQQELYKLYKADKSASQSSSGKKKNPKVEACATCGQILRPTDLKEHLAKHNPFSVFRQPTAK